MSQIFLSTHNRNKLKEKFGVTDSSISFAIHFKRHSQLARRIRDYAVNQLGAFITL